MLLPIGDDNRNRRIIPFLTWGLAIVNCVVWYFQITLGEAFTSGFAAVPLEITRGIDLVNPRILEISGKKVSIFHAPGPTPIFLTLITSMFLHGSLMHLFGNMLYLIIFGDQIEEYLGRGRFLLFYLICGITAGAGQIISQPSSIVPLVGASGAIAGVLAAYLMKFPRNKVRVLALIWVVKLPAIVVLGGWIVLQLIAQRNLGPSQSSGVAYMAHISGFIAGLVLLPVMGKKN